MFNNGQIFRNLNTIIRKEVEGQTISPQQFTELLLLCSWEKANADFFQYENSQVLTDSLRSLEAEDSVSLTAGVGTLPGDYWHALNATHDNTANQGKLITPIDIVSDVEFVEYAHSDLTAPSLFYPVLTIVDNEVKVLPTTIANASLRYLKIPETPFFDYYVDANDIIQYLLPEEQYTLQAGEEYRDGTTSGMVTSLSEELSYPEGERVQVMYMILSKLGVSLNEQDAAEYGIVREQKEEAQ